MTDRAGANQHDIAERAQPMGVQDVARPADPLTLPIRRRDPPIERPRQAADHDAAIRRCGGREHRREEIAKRRAGHGAALPGGEQKRPVVSVRRGLWHAAAAMPVPRPACNVVDALHSTITADARRAAAASISTA